jgi:quercetin dioxygenase-like cupin family protein
MERLMLCNTTPYRHFEERPMSTAAVELTTQFSHVRPEDTAFEDQGLRDFFLYRDLGIAAATGGKVIAQLVKANMAPEKGTGWHRHEADFHIVLMLKGWARFMYGDQETLVATGDCVHQAPGIVHFLFDYSEDMEYLEIVGPAAFTTLAAQAPCEVPGCTPWTKGA